VIKQALEAKISRLEADQGRKLKKPKKIPERRSSALVAAALSAVLARL
jgi:DNA recombination-dependent growth factor C